MIARWLICVFSFRRRQTVSVAHSIQQWRQACFETILSSNASKAAIRNSSLATCCRGRCRAWLDLLSLSRRLRKCGGHSHHNLCRIFCQKFVSIWCDSLEYTNSGKLLNQTSFHSTRRCNCCRMLGCSYAVGHPRCHAREEAGDTRQLSNSFTNCRTGLDVDLRRWLFYLSNLYWHHVWSSPVASVEEKFVRRKHLGIWRYHTGSSFCFRVRRVLVGYSIKKN